LVASQWY